MPAIEFWPCSPAKACRCWATCAAISLAVSFSPLVAQQNRPAAQSSQSPGSTNGASVDGSANGHGQFDRGQAATPPLVRRQAQQPEGFPLSPEMSNYVGQLLDHWQKMSDQVKAYRCDFTRYDYDADQVDYRDEQNRPAAYMIAQGEVRYAATDRAMFETQTLWRFAGPPEQPGQQAKYDKVEGYGYFGRTIHERWMTDGKAIYEYDFENKRINQANIPPELQGNVVESPLPFLFGANKKDILSRFWIRYVPKYQTDANGKKQLVQDEYWLEAFPKRINDSRMYSKLEIILASDTFMPKAIHMYSSEYNPARNNLSSRYFSFENREVNGQLARFKDFMNIFVKPRLAPGWKLIESKLGSSANATANAQTATQR